MNKLTQKTSWEQYVTPEMKSIEIKTEGVLCQSEGGGSSIGNATEDDWGTL